MKLICEAAVRLCLPFRWEAASGGEVLPPVAPHLPDRMAEVRLLLLLSLSSLALGVAILALRHQAFNKILLSVIFTSKMLILRRTLLQLLVIQEGSPAFQAWLHTPIPVFYKFHLFDILRERSD